LSEQQKASVVTTAKQAVKNSIRYRFGLDQALAIGALTLQVSCIRNPTNESQSVYFAYFAEREKVQAIADVFESLGFLDLEQLLKQVSTLDLLTVGVNYTVKDSLSMLERKLWCLGKRACTEGDRLKLLLLTSDLLLTTTANGVDMDEMVDPEIQVMEAWLACNLTPQAQSSWKKAAEKASSLGEQTYAEKLAAASQQILSPN